MLREHKNLKEYFTVPEAAEVLAVSVQTVRRLVNSGQIPARKVGRQWRILIKDLEESFHVR